MFGTKYSKTNRLQKTIKYQTNEQIFELKYGNTKLLGDTKRNQVKLVLAVFVSACLYQYSIKLYETNPLQLVSKIILDTFYLNKQFTIK